MVDLSRDNVEDLQIGPVASSIQSLAASKNQDISFILKLY